VAYTSSATAVDLGTGMTNYFKNIDPVGCPMTSCVLKESTCTTETTFHGVLIGAAAPFQITYIKNVEVGYDHSICIEC